MGRKNAVQSLFDLVYHDCKLYQKPAAAHHLLTVKPDVEVAADAVDVCFGSPVCAGVLGVGMTEGDVNTWNFFILQNVADNVLTSRVRPDCKLADAIAVLIGARVGTKFIAQI